MSLDKDYDKQIADLKRRMEDLERMKTMHVKKLEGVQRFQDVVAKFVADYGLTESELFVARADAIVAWIKASARDGEDAPLYWQQLRDHFAALAEKDARGKGKPGKRGAKGKPAQPTTLDEPTLKTGTYRNPFTREKIEKKRRNPKQLDAWIEEFGIGEVRTWRER